jgi:hypothetical protein
VVGARIEARRVTHVSEFRTHPAQEPAGGPRRGAAQERLVSELAERAAGRFVVAIELETIGPDPQGPSYRRRPGRRLG